MKKIVSFSGGRTSAYLCKIMLDKFGKENVDFIFMDTGAEHPKTYEFIKNVNNLYGLDLVCLQGDFNQPLGLGHTYNVISVDSLKHDLKVYTALVNKYGTPGISGKWCTSRMKEEVHDKYCDAVYGKGNYETWLGIRVDEPKRLKYKKKNIKYLAEISDFEKYDVNKFWSKQTFDLGIEEWLGNCVFCFKKSNLKIAAACIDEPELKESWLAMIDSAIERPEQERESRHVMYRGCNTLGDIEKMYEGIKREDIIARMRGGKMLDTEACSESCEIFSSEELEISEVVTNEMR